MSIKETILQSADRLFAQKGYESVSMQDISKDSKISIGSIYHAFKGGKEEIAYSILSNYFNKLILGFNELLNQEVLELTLRGCIKKIITLFVDLNFQYQSSPELQRISKSKETKELVDKIKSQIIGKFSLFLRLKIPNMNTEEASWKSKISYILCNSIFDEWEISHEQRLITEMEFAVIRYLDPETNLVVPIGKTDSNIK